MASSDTLPFPIGGSIGALKFYPDRLVYESVDMPSDSRYWRYRDIQNISQSERYRFEIATFEDRFCGQKTYNFQVREALPAQAYDYVWARVYPSKSHSGEESSGQVGRQAVSSERQARKQ